MGIAKSLRKSGNLGEFAMGLGSVIDQLVGDRSVDDLIKALAKTGADIESRFDEFPNETKSVMMHNTLTDPFLRGEGIKTQDQYNLRRTAGMENIKQQPDFKPDPEAGNKSWNDLVDFIISRVGKGDDPGDLNSAVTGLEMKREGLLPGETKGTKGVSHDPFKELINPVTGDVIKPAKVKPVKEDKKVHKRYGDNVYEVGKDGSIDWDNPVYKVPGKTGKKDKKDAGRDRAKLRSKVNQGIAKIMMMKNAKWDKETKMFRVPDPFGSVQYYDAATQEELTLMKEQVKNVYRDDFENLLLPEEGAEFPNRKQDAKEDIRAILPTVGDDLDKAIEKFFEMNPDWTREDMADLRLYFVGFRL